MNDYKIKDLDLFVEGTRLLVYSSFGKKGDIEIEELCLDMQDLNDEQKKEINEILTQKESLSISFEYIKKFKDYYVLSEDKYIDYVEALNMRMVSNLLLSLASKGLLESAFDPVSNDFVFWAKNDEENKKS